MTGIFQTDLLEHEFSVLRAVLGSNYHIGGKACIKAIDKLRKSSIINLAKSLEELLSGVENLKKPTKVVSIENLNSKILDYTSIIFNRFDPEEISVSRQEVIYYLAGVSVFFKFSKSKKPICNECKFFLSGPRIPEFSALLDEKEKISGALTHPAFFLLQKMFTLDFILNSLVFGKSRKKFLNKEENMFEIIVGIFETQIDLKDLKCPNDHFLRGLILSIFRRHCN